MCLRPSPTSPGLDTDFPPAGFNYAGCLQGEQCAYSTPTAASCKPPEAGSFRTTRRRNVEMKRSRFQSDLQENIMSCCSRDSCRAVCERNPAGGMYGGLVLFPRGFNGFLLDLERRRRWRRSTSAALYSSILHAAAPNTRLLSLIRFLRRIALENLLSL